MPGRVLIIDDLATNRIILKVKLSAAYYEVVQAASPEDAVAQMSTLRPDLILLGSHVADRQKHDDTNTPQAHALAHSIQMLQKRDDGAAPTPVVVMVGDDADKGTRIRALQAGATDVLARSLDDQILLAKMRSLMRQRISDQELRQHSLSANALGFAEAQQGFAATGQIVLVTENKPAARTMRTRLAPHSKHTLHIKNSGEIMGKAQMQGADLFIIHVQPGEEANGLRLLSELRANSRARACPIVALLPACSSAITANLLDLGAEDVMCLAMHPHEIALRLNEQIARKWDADRLRDQMNDGLQAAVIDDLTGIYNRRYAMSYLDRLIRSPENASRTFAVMIADLDYFKQINDTYGHPGGDAVLRRVAQLLRNHLGKHDLVARIGGEEFLIVVPDADQSVANEIATQLCALVRDTPITLPGQRGSAHVTISIGLAAGTVHYASAQDILSQADRALYQSKAAGRNTVRAA